jgi:hypothetical protein
MSSTKVDNQKHTDMYKKGLEKKTNADTVFGTEEERRLKRKHKQDLKRIPGTTLINYEDYKKKIISEEKKKEKRERGMNDFSNCMRIQSAPMVKFDPRPLGIVTKDTFDFGAKAAAAAATSSSSSGDVNMPDARSPYDGSRKQGGGRRLRKKKRTKKKKSKKKKRKTKRKTKRKRKRKRKKTRKRK